MELIKCWTDGACFPNPGRGGWGWTTLQGQEGSGGIDPTTNQIMEMTAAVEAIRTLYVPGRPLLVISDSQYVIRGATEWSKTWLTNGWRNSKKQPVANQPLWRELLDLLEGKPIKFEWVRGHTGDPGNEEADRLATLASGASQALIARCKHRYHGIQEPAVLRGGELP